MELKQKMQLKRLLVPELQQSLKVLTLPILELKAMVDEELVNDPLLEEVESPPSTLSKKKVLGSDLDFRLELVSKKNTLQDVLLRQLGMFANTDTELKIGTEIIGNIDDNGYLKVTLEEIAKVANAEASNVEKTLQLIQKFDPPGVAARTVSECLLIQLELAGEAGPILRKIIASHLEDIAKKNYSQIAKALKEPMEKIEPCVKKIMALNPKPGCNYSNEEINRIMPDIMIDLDEDDEEIKITINHEDIPDLKINPTYQQMLKSNQLDPQTKEFLARKMQNAMELLRAISKRQVTLRKIVETVIELQQEAIRHDLSCLKPLTFKDVAEKINLHETTVCRAIMNKYVKLPYGIVALKDFFPSRIRNHAENEPSVSSVSVKKVIKELIDQEDKKHPLSDQDISRVMTQEKNLQVCRRTVAKYREELKILSSTYRRER